MQIKNKRTGETGELMGRTATGATVQVDSNITWWANDDIEGLPPPSPEPTEYVDIKTGERLVAGTAIYYAGDRANEEGFGFVESLESVGETYNIHIWLDDERRFTVSPAYFAPGIGTKFMTYDKYKKEREKAIRSLEKALKTRERKPNDIMPIRELETAPDASISPELARILRVHSDQGLELYVWENDKDIRLDHIVVLKGYRNMGLGTNFMDDLISYADATNKRIRVSPSQKDPDFGTTSRSRLVNFYKRFGFVENKGRNKDFTISQSMYRTPR